MQVYLLVDPSGMYCTCCTDEDKLVVEVYLSREAAKAAHPTLEAYIREVEVKE